MNNLPPPFARLRTGTAINALGKLIFMAVLCNRAGHYIFALWFLSSIFFFFSSPNLSGHRLDVYHTCTQVVSCKLGLTVAYVDFAKAFDSVITAGSALRRHQPAPNKNKRIFPP